MDKLDIQLGLVIKSAWAESTLKTRNSQWSKFIHFCKADGLEPLPPDVLTVARYLVNRGVTCAYSTCNHDLSAIVMLHKFFDHDASFRDTFVIKLVMKGLARSIGKHVSQKMGLTPKDFIDIYEKLDLSDINTITKWSALMLAFRSLLRKSNIVQTNLKETGMVILRSDIEFSSRGVLLNVKKSKTIQYKEYQLRIPVDFVNKNCLCAATMLATHLARTPHIKDGPLFFTLIAGHWRPLRYAELLKFLKDCVRLIGLDPADVGLHSMRRSGAAFLQSMGISLVDIMNAGTGSPSQPCHIWSHPLIESGKLKTRLSTISITCNCITFLIIQTFRR